MREFIESFQHFFRSRADTDVVRQIHPAHRARGIDQEFSGPRDVGAVRTRARMEKIVATDHLRFYIGQKRKCVTHLLRMSAVDLNGIDTDTSDANAAGIKITKPLLKTPQLGVAEWSPMSAIKDQERGSSRRQIGQCDRFTVLIGQREFGRLLTNARRTG
jgi:hypothetical protein